MLDLRGSIPTFIFISDGKYHDSNVIDEIIPLPGAIYLLDKAYIDFASLYKMHSTGSYFITRAKVTLDYQITASNFNKDEQTGLRSDRTIKLNGPQSRRLYPEPLRMVEYYDDEKDMIFDFLPITSKYLHWK
ncbi:MAG: hypothetical protein JXK95_08615 [Bacteroidales bacterium]|nr:hypothetical protein [Bacteroidales bacterium]